MEEDYGDDDDFEDIEEDRKRIKEGNYAASAIEEDRKRIKEGNYATSAKNAESRLAAVQRHSEAAEAHQRLAAVQRHSEAAEAHHEKSDSGSRQQNKYHKWGARSVAIKPGKYKNIIDEHCAEARSKPGPGQYTTCSGIGNKGSGFTKGLRFSKSSDDDHGGSYIDPLNSSTMTKQGTKISLSNHERQFMLWDQKQVGKWLEEIGLGHLSESWRKKKVQGQDLLDIAPDAVRDLLGVDAFDDRKRLIKEISVLKGHVPGPRTLPNLGPGRYTPNTHQIYQITRKSTTRKISMSKGPPMPIYEDYVQKEAYEKPASNSYQHVSEKYQLFMNSNLSKGCVKFGEPGSNLTAVERRCKDVEDDPSPIDYQPPCPEPRHKGSTIGKAKRKDIFSVVDWVPGPGAYSGPGVQLYTISGRVNAACKLGTCTNIKFPKIVERRECKGQETGTSHAQRAAQRPTDQGGNDDILILSQDAPPKKIDRKCVSAEPAYLWPEVAAPEPWELQSIVEELYHSDVFAKMSCHATSRQSKTRQNKRGFISRRAGTAGTGGTLSLREWHELMESRGIVPHHLSKVDAIHILSNSRRSNMSIKFRAQGNKTNELKMALRILAKHLDLKVGNMPLPAGRQSITDTKIIQTEGEKMGLMKLAKEAPELVARFVDVQATLHKNRGKAKSYDEKQLEVGEFNETWLDGIDERIRKIRVTEDRNNAVTSTVLKDLHKKVKATGVRTTF